MTLGSDLSGEPSASSVSRMYPWTRRMPVGSPGRLPAPSARKRTWRRPCPGDSLPGTCAHSPPIVGQPCRGASGCVTCLNTSANSFALRCIFAMSLCSTTGWISMCFRAPELYAA